jgi:hypothetical protein
MSEDSLEQTTNGTSAENSLVGFTRRLLYELTVIKYQVSCIYNDEFKIDLLIYSEEAFQNWINRLNISEDTKDNIKTAVSLIKSGRNDEVVLDEYSSAVFKLCPFAKKLGGYWFLINGKMIKQFLNNLLNNKDKEITFLKNQIKDKILNNYSDNSLFSSSITD